ncbi:stress responsive A/B barrel domain-containing protein [Staphylotrichum tortipilum]|uniref:Stress responsive A/B barrel domain-containing protein n=1 Tax=Staphylotrichum tortipilum TaxID=2831512 RepID=A0AAN6MKA5_9PEZI|nr:stress responsive A/B barrel domain-containing protein [Staphylotrichum longicolle]
MANFARESPRAFRGLLIALGLLTVFLFFDPIGFASTSMASHMPPATTRAVTHLVMFQFKPGADHAAVDAACEEMLGLKDLCLSPNSQYPYITSITGGKDNSLEGLQGGLTHAFVVQFANPDDRNYYVEKDPAYRAFKETIDPLVEKVTVLDFTHGTFD